MNTLKRYNDFVNESSVIKESVRNLVIIIKDILSDYGSIDNLTEDKLVLYEDDDKAVVVDALLLNGVKVLVYDKHEEKVVDSYVERYENLDEDKLEQLVDLLEEYDEEHKK